MRIELQNVQLEPEDWLHYHGSFRCQIGGVSSCYQICVCYLGDIGRVILIGERGDNPGVSVTNAIEDLIQALDQAGMTGWYPPALWIEHYNAKSYPAGLAQAGEQGWSWDLGATASETGRTHDPTWTRIVPNREALESLDKVSAIDPDNDPCNLPGLCTPQAWRSVEGERNWVEEAIKRAMYLVHIGRNRAGA